MTNSSNPFACWFGNDVHGCVFDTWTDTVPEAAFGMFVVGIVFLPLYARTRDPILPTVVLMLLSTFFFAILPGALASIAYTTMFFAFAIALFVLLYRTVL